MKLSIISYKNQYQLSIPKEYRTKQGAYQVVLDELEVNELYEYLKKLTNVSIINEDKRYFEEVSTYANDVERTLSISNNNNNNSNLNLNLVVYTDKDDDNCIFLSHKLIAKLAGLIYPYSVSYN